MSQPTHTIKLRDGKAVAEQVTEKQLASIKEVFKSRFSDFEVTPIEAPAPKPALSSPAKSKSEAEAAK